MQLYYIECLESVNQPVFEATFKVLDGEVACDVISLAGLLIDLIAGKEKLISHLGEESAITFLVLCRQAQVVETYVDRRALKGIRLGQLVISVLVNVTVNFIIVH